MPELPKIDEFTFVLLAGLLLIFVLAFSWAVPTEGAPVVEASEFTIKAIPGEETKFDFTIGSVQGLTSVNLTAKGEVSDWIKFSKNNFNVDDSTVVVVTIEPPKDVEFGTYSGKVYIQSEGGKDEFSLSVEVVDEDELTTTERMISENEFPIDFSVVYAKGTDLLDFKQDVAVSRSYVSSRSETLTGLITDDRIDITTGGSVQLLIEDTNGFGNLIVYINDQKIYDNEVGAGEILIPIDKDYIERGNIVKIEADYPGIVFWGATRYDIQSAKLNLDYEGASAQSFNITLNDYEIENFKQFNLFGRVKTHSSYLPNMLIKVNNQISYFQKPPVSILETSLDEDMFGNPLYLKEGKNTLLFMFEENAVYELTDAFLTVEYYQ